MTWRHFKRCTVKVILRGILDRLPVMVAVTLITWYGRLLERI